MSDHETWRTLAEEPQTNPGAVELSDGEQTDRWALRGDLWREQFRAFAGMKPPYYAFTPTLWRPAG